MHPLLKSHILFYSNGLAISHGLPNKSHVKVSNGRKAAILNLTKSIFFKMHPLLKSHILFYSNGSYLARFTQYQACRGEWWLIGGQFEFDFFLNASSPGTLQFAW